jgi:hypothetical protein
VGEVLGIPAPSVGLALGTNRVEASWVVDATTSMPTGYASHLLHTELFRSEVIKPARSCINYFAAARNDELLSNTESPC